MHADWHALPRARSLRRRRVRAGEHRPLPRRRLVTVGLRRRHRRRVARRWNALHPRRERRSDGDCARRLATPDRRHRRTARHRGSVGRPRRLVAPRRVRPVAGPACVDDRHHAGHSGPRLRRLLSRRHPHGHGHRGGGGSDHVAARGKRAERRARVRARFGRRGARGSSRRRTGRRARLRRGSPRLRARRDESLPAARVRRVGSAALAGRRVVRSARAARRLGRPGLRWGARARCGDGARSRNLRPGLRPRARDARRARHDGPEPHPRGARRDDARGPLAQGGWRRALRGDESRDDPHHGAAPFPGLVDVPVRLQPSDRRGVRVDLGRGTRLGLSRRTVRRTADAPPRLGRLRQRRPERLPGPPRGGLRLRCRGVGREARHARRAGPPA